MRRFPGIAVLAGGLALTFGAAATEQALEGTWVAAGNAGEVVELEFDGWDMLTVRVDGETSVIADYALEGSQLFITDIEGPLACAARVATSTYEVQQGEDRLRLSAAGDACNERADRLDGRSFTRSE